MIHKQRGITFIGLLSVFLLVGVVAYGGVRLTPVYLEYFKISTVLEGLKDELDGRAATRTTIQNSIEKRLGIESVRALRTSDFKISKQGTGHRVSVAYDREAPYIANVKFLVSFNKSVEIIR